MLGDKGGPVGAAWATALATPRAGHAAFVVVAAPNVPVKPMTLFVNKATVESANERHGRLTWGAAQAGVAAGVTSAHRQGVLHADAADELELVAAFVLFAPEIVHAAGARSAPVMSRARAARAWAGVAHEWAGTHLPDDVDWQTVAGLLGRVVSAAPVAGAPLFAGWRALDEPEEL